jgi:DNA-binding transcriptional LysR family regulator
MIDNLKALAAVIDNKSLTKAASRLSLTQSAISRRIQQLEEALGGTLLDRTQRPPSPAACCAAAPAATRSRSWMRPVSPCSSISD